MIDLAQNNGDSPVSMPSEPSKPYYPSIRFDAKQLKALGLEDCELGEPYEMTIRVKATNISEDGTGFDIVSADKATEASEEDDSEGEAPKPEKKAKRATVAPGKGKILRPPADDDEE